MTNNRKWAERLKEIVKRYKDSMLSRANSSGFTVDQALADILQIASELDQPERKGPRRKAYDPNWKEVR